MPKDAGEEMVYPHDVDGQPTMKKGMPLLDREGKPKGRGIVFTNYTDDAIQAARGDGKRMIILNGISDEEGHRLLEMYERLVPDPEKANGRQIQTFLESAHAEMGIEDIFNGDRGKIPGFEIIKLHPGSSECGLFLRRSDEPRRAIIGYGEGVYKGPAASPQRFKDNVVAVSGPKHTWMVQTRAFLNTYRHPDDREIKLEELPAFRMREMQPPAAFVPG